MTPEQQKQIEKLDRSLTNQAPNEDQINRIETVRSWGRDLGRRIILGTSPSREQSLALTHLEETVMWAVKAIVLEDT